MAYFVVRIINMRRINVTEYQMGNHKWTFQRNWQHKTKKNKTKPQHNIYWTPLCANRHK